MWKASDLWHDIGHVINNAEDYKSCFFFEILSLLQENTRNCFVLMIWGLWKRRNDKVWDNVTKPIQVSIQCALDLLFGWQEARKEKMLNSGAAVSRCSNEVAVWSRPAAEKLKCNVDAILFEDGR